ncbi:MAG TPA: hypothetical protein VGM83_17805 [Devosiaceae bacterium]
MKQTFKPLAVAAALAVMTLSNSAYSEQLPKMADVDGWSISVDPSLGNGCFATSIFEDGSGLRFGFNFNQQAPLYISIIKHDWASIEDGKDYDVTLQFDRSPPWNATATGIHMGDFPGLIVSAADSNFFDQLARKQHVTWYYNNVALDTYNLKGTYAAVDALLACQEMVNKGGAGVTPPSKDPFGPPSKAPNKSDPFA